jgi:hypothetical protein
MRIIPFILLLSLGSLFLPSCSTKSARLTVLQPARFTVPEHISKVAVVDRSKPSNGWLNVLEGVLTGEAIGQDRRSREEAVSGLIEGLRNTPRFEVIRTGIEMTGSRAGANLPAPLSWSEVERICQLHQADAVVTIESFDTNTGVTTKRRENTQKDKNGKQITTIDYRSEMRTAVTMGWRMYDPRSKNILDEFTTDDFLLSDATGDTEQAAVRQLPAPVTISRRVAFIGGQHYGMRIAPTYVSIQRQYYVKAKGAKASMQKAGRYAETGSWEKAAELWKILYEKYKEEDKIAGRAAYNMAVAAEMKGNLVLALDWAKKSWELHRNKKARQYVFALQMRLEDQEQVSRQMHYKS